MPIGGGQTGSAQEVKAGGAYFTLWGKDLLSGTLEKLQRKAVAFGAFMKSIGKTSGVAGAALAAPLAALFKGGFDRSADIARMSDEFEVPIELMARLKHAADDAGVSVQDVMSDTSGRFDALIDRPAGFDPKAARQAVETQRQLAEATRALQYALLPILDIITPMVGKVAAFTKENATLVKAVAAVAAGLLALSAASLAFGPALSLLVGGGGLVVKLATGLWTLMKVLSAVRLGMIATAVAGAIAAVAKLVWAGAVGVLSGALTVLGGVLSFLVSPIGLLTAGAIALAYVFRSDLKDAGAEVGDALGQMFTRLGEVFALTFGGIVDAVKAGDLQLAFRVMGQGVKAFWAEMLAGLAMSWNRLVTAIAQTVKNNKWLMFALGGVGGAVAGGKIGAFFGPKGLLIGAGIGAALGAGGGLLAGAFAEDIAEGIKLDAGKFRADADAAVAGLGGVRMEAANAAKAEQDRFQEYQKKIAGGFGAVKGNFQTFGTARQQFGYANEATKQTALQARIAAAVEGAEKGIKGINDGLKPK